MTDQSTTAKDSQESANHTSGKIRKWLSRLSGAGLVFSSIVYLVDGAISILDRITGMLASVFSRNSHDYPVVDEMADDFARFEASMRMHQVDGPKLVQMVRNTRKNFILYFVLLALASLASSASFYFHTPDSAFSGLIRISAIPVLAALAFKHAYSNWLFRNRRLSPPIEYFRSGDLWPKAIDSKNSDRQVWQ